MHAQHVAQRLPRPCSRPQRSCRPPRPIKTKHSALYEQFLQAQNARDLEAVRATLLESDRFLWVSDGRSVWGTDALVQRMSLFQRAPVWRVVPGLDRAVTVPVSDRSAFLHLPLVLEIGQEQQPSRLRFLVSVLGVETAAGWRIAALFTTENKNAD